MKREHPVGWDRKERRCGVLKDKCLDLSSPPKAEPKTGTLKTGFLGGSVNEKHKLENWGK